MPFVWRESHHRLVYLGGNGQHAIDRLAPRILVNDWNYPVVAESDAQIDGFKPD